jgi:hypothetical protein
MVGGVGNARSAPRHRAAVIVVAAAIIASGGGVTALALSDRSPDGGRSVTRTFPAPEKKGTATPVPAPTAPASPATASPSAPPLIHLGPPAAIPPVIAPAPRGEGRWHAVGRSLDGVPTTYETSIHTDRSSVIGLAWMDTKLLSAVLINGTTDPGGTGWRYSAKVPAWRRSELAATFNSGFHLWDSRGGYFNEGRTVRPLVSGAASLVIYRSGLATVVGWDRGVRMSSQIQAVRQNLSLMVDGGQVTNAVSAQGFKAWGLTLGGGESVWRSGLGVTAAGALVYGAGISTPIELARALALAGCVRAMELDINPEWTVFNAYAKVASAPFGLSDRKLLPTMQSPFDRFLYPDERDFVAMFIRPLACSTSAPACSRASPQAGRSAR